MGTFDRRLYSITRDLFPCDDVEPYYVADRVAHLEFPHPLQLDLGGPLDVRFVVNDRASGRELLRVDLSVDLAIGRPDVTAAHIEQGLRAALLPNAPVVCCCCAAPSS
jgi:hypothetical protein